MNKIEELKEKIRDGIELATPYRLSSNRLCKQILMWNDELESELKTEEEKLKIQLAEQVINNLLIRQYSNETNKYWEIYNKLRELK